MPGRNTLADAAEVGGMSYALTLNTNPPPTSVSASSSSSSPPPIPSSSAQIRKLAFTIHQKVKKENLFMASSSSSTASWNFDVFLSFRGVDTREGFTGFLYDALSRHGFVAFIDEQLRSGESISQQLIGVIEQSRASIVVFSENYASSGWCLDELAKIMEWKKEMGHQVWPVFYRVDPSEVRHQSGKTGEHLLKFEKRFGKESERVRGWRIALNSLANLSGWHYKLGYSFHCCFTLIFHGRKKNEFHYVKVLACHKLILSAFHASLEHKVELSILTF